jgi:HEAT repeat protein
VIPEAVRDILDGKDFARNVRLLKPERREAIRYLLGVFDGTIEHRLAPGEDPRDAHEAGLAALGELGRGDVDFLVTLLERELLSNKNEPAFSLAWVLAHLDTPRRVEPLMKAIRHQDEFVRWAACEGLRRARAKRARALLNAAASDRSSLVRGTAVDALKSIGDETSLAVLEKRLRDRYPGIRVAAAKAARAIRKRRPNKRLKLPPRVD